MSHNSFERKQPANGQMSPQHVDAITLAGWGFEVGPLMPPTWPNKAAGKRPMWNMSFTDFTDNIDQINQWWCRWPDANIGGRPPAHVVVLDVDVRSGGLDTWAAINAGHTLPATYVTETGTGGLHVWFRLPYRMDLRDTAGKGIDIKHHGGLLVMPGSIHPKTSRLYRCLSWCDPAELPELPHHLQRHVFKPVKPLRPIIPVNLIKKGDGGHLVATLLAATAGTRNTTLNSVLFQAYQFGYEHRVDELLDAALTIGLDEQEIEATHRSARDGAEGSAA